MVWISVGRVRSTLFMPRLPEAYTVWMGALKRCERVWDGARSVGVS